MSQIPLLPVAARLAARGGYATVSAISQEAGVQYVRLARRTEEERLLILILLS